jgi:hypothetical protein
MTTRLRLAAPELVCHPVSPCKALVGCAVSVWSVDHRRPAVIQVDYTLTGDLAGVCVPPVIKSSVVDELWQHTCFELFLAVGDSPEYVEFNFSPSTCWAAYRFSDYRQGMRLAQDVRPELTLGAPHASWLGLSVTLDLSAWRLPRATPAVPWRIGLSAVVKDIDGHLSYWALAHPPGEPDFHAPDCFALHVKGVL